MGIALHHRPPEISKGLDSAPSFLAVPALGTLHFVEPGRVSEDLDIASKNKRTNDEPKTITETIWQTNGNTSDII